jgi:hypothetical protein
MSPTGSDEFDALDPTSGVYLTPAGLPSTAPNGEMVVGTGSLLFSDLAWSQKNKTSDVLEGPLATRGTTQAPSQTEQLLGQLMAGNYSFSVDSGSATNQSPGVTAFATWVPYVWTVPTPLAPPYPMPQPPAWGALPSWWFSGQ